MVQRVNHWTCGILAAALLTCPSGLWAADAPDADIRKLIVDGVTGGIKPSVYVNFLGKSTRVQVVGADNNGVNALSEGSVLPVAWKELTTDQYGGLASEFAKTGADYLLLARFYMNNKMQDRAEKMALAAIERDKGLTPEISDLFKSAAPAPVPTDAPKPVVPAPATVSPALNSVTPDAAAPNAPPEPAKSNLAGLTGFGSSPTGTAAKIPDIKTPLMFDTPESDAVLAALQVFPKNNAWNEDISKAPVLPESDRMIAHIGADKHAFVDFSFNFIFVPTTQPRLDVPLRSPGESDKGPYPVPDNAPVEGWPIFWSKTPVPLDEFQRRTAGDRHCLVIDALRGIDYEFYRMIKTNAGWTAGNEATFDFGANKLRPKSWTSADAAGLSIFAGLLRYDEVKKGAIDHALRFTVSATRKAFIYPATHHAGSGDDPAVPAMGQRFRLKAGADISGLPKEAQVVAQALKKYGLIVADNGSDWFISATLDKRFNTEAVKAVSKFKGSDFEAIVTTGER